MGPKTNAMVPTETTAVFEVRGGPTNGAIQRFMIGAPIGYGEALAHFLTIKEPKMTCHDIENCCWVAAEGSPQITADTVFQAGASYTVKFPQNPVSKIQDTRIAKTTGSSSDAPQWLIRIHPATVRLEFASSNLAEAFYTEMQLRYDMFDEEKIKSIMDYTGDSREVVKAGLKKKIASAASSSSASPMKEEPMKNAADDDAKASAGAKASADDDEGVDDRDVKPLAKVRGSKSNK